ncbi:MAG: YihY/virulence factor BrkB family protein [Eubacteriales bacterium]|nr:YihY/virulence factor BrkB family protein [Eubacteriales bacterium]
MKDSQEKTSKFKMLIQYGFKFGGMISDNYTAACAAQAAFFLLLSIVPLVSLILAIATYLPFTQQDVITVLIGVIPDDMMPYIQDIINDLYSRASKTVISVSIITLIWSASRGIVSLMDGFNSMYHIRGDSNVVKIRLSAIAYTVMFIILFVFMLSFYVGVSHYYKEYITNMFAVKSFGRELLLFSRYLMGWLVFYSFILMMFVILPGGFGIPMGKEEKINFKERVRSQAPGAAFASVAWLIITQGLKLYMRYFSNYSVMYGSLAGIVIAMLWLYFCMYSLFIGAIINYLLSKGYLTRVKKMLK